MHPSVQQQPASTHPVLSEIRAIPAKASLRKQDHKPETDGWREQIGSAIERTRNLAGLSLKQFADVVGRDERQVARWITSVERPQFDALFAAEALRQPLIVALAEVAGSGVEIETTVRIRRRSA